MFKNLFSGPAILTPPPVQDVPEEHRIALGRKEDPDIEIVFIEFPADGLRLVFYLDKTGTTSAVMSDLDAHLKARGWYLHGNVIGIPPAQKTEGEQ